MELEQHHLVVPQTHPLLQKVWQAEWATLRLLLELSRPHPRTRPRGLSSESVQRAPPEGRQVALERPADNLVMVAKKLMNQ